MPSLNIAKKRQLTRRKGIQGKGRGQMKMEKLKPEETIHLKFIVRK